MRLITNKLFPEIFLTDEIQKFALAELHRLKALKSPVKTMRTEVQEAGEKRPRENGVSEPADGETPLCIIDADSSRKMFTRSLTESGKDDTVHLVTQVIVG